MLGRVTAIQDDGFIVRTQKQYDRLEGKVIRKIKPQNVLIRVPEEVLREIKVRNTVVILPNLQVFLLEKREGKAYYNVPLRTAY